MLRSFLSSLAMTALSAGAVGSSEPVNTHPDTWRWAVSGILDAQRAAGRADVSPVAQAASFQQRYERYSAVGLPERDKR